MLGLHAEPLAREPNRKTPRVPQEHRFGSVPVPCLTVVIPCYNEEATVTGALKRVLESPYVAEVIFVDDGSTDGEPGAGYDCFPTRD